MYTLYSCIGWLRDHLGHGLLATATVCTHLAAWLLGYQQAKVEREFGKRRPVL